MSADVTSGPGKSSWTPPFLRRRARVDQKRVFLRRNKRATTIGYNDGFPFPLPGLKGIAFTRTIDAAPLQFALALGKNPGTVR